VNDTTPAAVHLQISGDLPWVVLGWRTYPEHGLEPELVAIYGPVPTQDEAAQLVQTLTEVFPAHEENFTVMPTFPVGPAPSGPDAAVAA
jgi:hypothetical protein